MKVIALACKTAWFTRTIIRAFCGYRIPLPKFMPGQFDFWWREEFWPARTKAVLPLLDPFRHFEKKQ